MAPSGTWSFPLSEIAGFQRRDWDSALLLLACLVTSSGCFADLSGYSQDPGGEDNSPRDPVIPADAQMRDETPDARAVIDQAAEGAIDSGRDSVESDVTAKDALGETATD